MNEITLNHTDERISLFSGINCMYFSHARLTGLSLTSGTTGSRNTFDGKSDGVNLKLGAKVRQQF